MRIELEILNWEKFNPRKDVKANHWFRLDNSFIDSPDFYDFTAEERLTWILLLSLASKKSNGKVLLNLEHAERGCGLSKAAVLTALEKLSKIKCINVDVTWTLRGRDVDVSLQTNKQTIQTNITNKQTLLSAKKIKKPETPEALRARARVRTFWLDSFQKRFGHAYRGDSSPFFHSTVKRIVEALGVDGAEHSMTLYLAWLDPFVVKSGHALHHLLGKLHAMEAAQHRPQQTMSMLAQGRAYEKTMTEPEQRLQEISAYAQRAQTDRARSVEHSEPSGRKLSERAESSVFGERNPFHDEHLAFDSSPDADGYGPGPDDP